MTDDITRPSPPGATSPSPPGATSPSPPGATRLHTDDGLVLEAEFAPAASTPAASVPAEGPDELGRAIVILAHPHPLQGGSMRSLVTSELFAALPARGLSVLRFNFRGVEGSEGRYGEGRAEHADIVAAIDEVAARRGALGPAGAATPIVLAGWSFGADVSLTVTDERLAGWFLIAAPLRVMPADAFVAAHDPRPKSFTVPERDQFRPPDGVREQTRGWVNTAIHVVPGADHFLVGRTMMAVDLLDEFVASFGM